MKSFLQSDAWAEFQKSLGRKVFTYDQEGIRASIIKQELIFKKSYLYIPYGPMMHLEGMLHGVKNSVQKFVAGLSTLAREEGSLFVKAEPLHDAVAELLVPPGFERSSKHIQPHRTVILDLTKNQEELLDGMHHKTRYNIRVAERERVVIEQSDQTGLFLQLMKKTTERDKFNAHPEWYYHHLLAFPDLDTKLWIAWHESKPVAAAITLEYGDSAYYLHGASDYDHRAVMGPHLLHWRIMLEMKKHGMTTYDLWGIDAKKWPGVTRFKLGWAGHSTGSGGRQVEYPGAFDLVISKPWHALYQVAQSLRK